MIIVEKEKHLLFVFKKVFLEFQLRLWSVLHVELNKALHLIYNNMDIKFLYLINMIMRRLQIMLVSVLKVYLGAIKAIAQQLN